MAGPLAGVPIAIKVRHCCCAQDGIRETPWLWPHAHHVPYAFLASVHWKPTIPHHSNGNNMHLMPKGWLTPSS